MALALIVDDDKSGLSGLVEWVREESFDVRQAGSIAEARSALDAHVPDLALIDLQLPDGNGLDLIPLLKQHPDVEIVVITAHGTIDSAVQALKLGASDYLTKPIDLTRLQRFLHNVRRTLVLRNEVHELRGELRRLGRFGLLIGASPSMQQVYDLIAKVGPTNSTVLIVGETGVGKELVAQMVHRVSRRSQQPFVALNCAGVPATLIESELFGHEKGSFTGADRRRKGVFEQADGGTLFLDEVLEMPVELQAKLLRVLETGKFQRIGGEDACVVDVRIVAATNRDPEQAVRDGKLREDLHYRLNVFPIRVPPLRERGDDLELLARHFLDRQNEEASANKRLSEGAWDKLRLHRWNGNVRELRNVVERAFILAGDRIDTAHVPLDVPVVRSTDSNSLEVPIGAPLDEIEQRVILTTLEKVGGRRKDAAEMLGISLKTLYNRLKKYGL